jgi:hypothetical protein
MLDFLLINAYVTCMTIQRSRLTELHYAMPKPSLPDMNQTLPKIHLPLEAGVGTHDSRQRAESFVTRSSQYVSGHTPADLYISAIRGEDLSETSKHPSLVVRSRFGFILVCAAVCLSVNLCLWMLLRPTFVTPQEEKAELIFEPSRVSEGFAEQIDNQWTGSEENIPLSDTVLREEEDTSPSSASGDAALTNIPKRRVIVVTERDRDRLLKTLKTPSVHETDTESLDTYIDMQNSSQTR